MFKIEIFLGGDVPASKGIACKNDKIRNINVILKNVNKRKNRRFFQKVKKWV